MAEQGLGCGKVSQGTVQRARWGMAESIPTQAKQLAGAGAKRDVLRRLNDRRASPTHVQQVMLLPGPCRSVTRACPKPQSSTCTAARQLVLEQQGSQHASPEPGKSSRTPCHPFRTLWAGQVMQAMKQGHTEVDCWDQSTSLQDRPAAMASHLFSAPASSHQNIRHPHREGTPRLVVVCVFVLGGGRAHTWCVDHGANTICC